MRLEEEISNSKPIPPRERAMLNVLFTASWIDNILNRHMRNYGITHPQYNILRILNGSAPNGLCVLDIKGRMIDRSSNVSRLVEKLRERGLLHRIASESDRRMVLVTISDSGLLLLQKIEQEVFNVQDNKPGNNLQEADLALLADLLDRFRE